MQSKQTVSDWQVRQLSGQGWQVGELKYPSGHCCTHYWVGRNKYPLSSMQDEQEVGEMH